MGYARELSIAGYKAFDLMYWGWNSNTLATLCKEWTHLKRPWYWERLKAVKEGDDTVWNGWMASLTRLTWVWTSSGNCWWTGKPGVLQFIGSKSVRHDWATELTLLYQLYCCICQIATHVVSRDFSRCPQVPVTWEIGSPQHTQLNDWTDLNWIVVILFFIIFTLYLIFSKEVLVVL